MTYRPIYLFSAVVIGAFALILFSWSGADRQAELLRPDDADFVKRGAQVYAAHCASCHGERLQGQPNWRERDSNGLLPPPPHDRSGHTWHHPDEVLFRITKHGVAKVTGMADYQTVMPVYEGALGDEDIIAVLSWIKAQWPEEIRQRHDQINADYRKSPQAVEAR